MRGNPFWAIILCAAASLLTLACSGDDSTDDGATGSPTGTATGYPTAPPTGTDNAPPSPTGPPTTVTLDAGGPEASADASDIEADGGAPTDDGGATGGDGAPPGNACDDVICPVCQECVEGIWRASFRRRTWGFRKILPWRNRSN